LHIYSGESTSFGLSEKISDYRVPEQVKNLDSRETVKSGQARLGVVPGVIAFRIPDGEAIRNTF
jgi:hypothetical protein